MPSCFIEPDFANATLVWCSSPQALIPQQRWVHNFLRSLIWLNILRAETICLVIAINYKLFSAQPLNIQFSKAHQCYILYQKKYILLNKFI